MPSPELTPQERLAISRKALVQHMSRRRSRHTDADTIDEFDESEEPSQPASGKAWGLIKYAVRTWWYRHPASMVADLARPLLDDYAHDHPFKLLGFSAGAGVAIAVIRPWRMVSAAVLMGALKSSGLSSALLASVVHSARPQHPLDQAAARP